MFMAAFPIRKEMYLYHPIFLKLKYFQSKQASLIVGSWEGLMEKDEEIRKEKVFQRACNTSEKD